MIGQRRLSAFGSSVEIPQGHVAAYVFIYGTLKMKFENVQIC